MKRLTTGTYILVADGKKALVAKNIGTAFEPKLEVLRAEQQDNPANRAQGRDAPGRMPDGGQGQRSAMEATDWHQLAEDEFAATMARRLADMARKGDFDRLIVVAPPKALAALRGAMDDTLRPLVVAEIDKDLTGMALDKITARIMAALDEMNG